MSTACKICEEHDASIWCRDCQTCYCDKCDGMVHRPKALSKHRRGGAAEAVISNYCSDHEGKLLSVYCHDCKKPICENCCFRDHKGHDCDLVTDILHGKKETLKERLSIMKLEMAGVTALGEQVKICLEKLVDDDDACVDGVDSSSTCEKAKRIVREVFDALGQVLNGRRDVILSEIEALAKKKESELEAQRDLVNGRISAAYVVMQDTESLLEACGPCSMEMNGCTSCSKLPLRMIN